MTSVAQPSPGVCRAGRDVDGSNLAPGRTRAPRGTFCPPVPPAREGQPWTEEEHRSLRVAWADGSMKRADVAELLRRSVQSVAMQAWRLRLGSKAKGGKRKVTRDNSALVAELLRRGISPETANMLRRTK